MLVESRSLPAITEQIGADGTVTFSNLDCGLYVVYQTEAAPGFEPINAFCVSLPMSFGDSFVYDVQASPKPRPEKPTTPAVETTTQPVTTPEPVPGISMDDKLPQTGQLWWPTWMLGAFGFILLGLGILMRYLLRQSTEDADV